ncbi:UNVERIFIED_CONTAM: hypothetical protein PYX00_004529 [Menopon gallinae]|uniref:Rhythmically expressed gene 5 protein n=1 Tax=Menopon gallinae TaxID=328185 RepID=A0AAW2I4J3_9NEOP
MRFHAKMWIFSVYVSLLCLVPSIHGSAIPMWEYLSRGEKMNHLFNLFVQQVEKHCSTRPEPDCSKLLLVYGLTNLAKMEDESLDDMDPYQRGANEIVWDSMMKGSSKHGHVQEYTTSKSVTSNAIQNTTPTPQEEDLSVSDPGSLEAASNVNIEATEPQSFLLGPMVVRVLPNGMPIPGEKNHLPKDEDIEEFAPSKFRRLTDNRPSPARRLGFDDGSRRSQDYHQQQKIASPYHSNSYETFRVRSPIYATRP